MGGKKKKLGTSLVVQWIQICLPVLEHGFDPWSGVIPHAAEQLSLCATTKEPARVYSPYPVTGEAATVRNPRTAAGEWPPPAATRKACAAVKTLHDHKQINK